MKDIMIVAEGLSKQEAVAGEFFISGPGKVFRRLLDRAGLKLQACHTTCVFREPSDEVARMKFFGGKKDQVDIKLGPFQGRYLLEKYVDEYNRLWKEIEHVQPNVVIALGGIALWATTGFDKITESRGFILKARDGKTKVLPTVTPLTALRQRIYFPLLNVDLNKAAAHSTSKEFPQIQHDIYIAPDSVEDLEQTVRRILEPCPWLTCDIETAGNVINEIGFARHDGKAAVVIPFLHRNEKRNYWKTFKEEKQVWNLVRRLLQKPIIGQNFGYDLWWLYGKAGVPTPGYAYDTILAANLLAAELPKDLATLASIYLDTVSWKHLAEFKKGPKA